MERLNQAMDGELARNQLSEQEQRELASVEAAIGGVLAALPPAAPRGLEPEVMARVRALAAGRVAAVPPARRRTAASLWSRRALEWIWSPRAVSLTLRPAYGLGALALLALLLAGPMRSWEAGERASGVAETRVFVHFRLKAPGAARVALAGDFTGWQPSYAMHQAAPGVWSVMVALPPGVHDYAFVVDGRSWRPDPLAPAISDGFGGTNSRIAVLPPVVGRES